MAAATFSPISTTGLYQLDGYSKGLFYPYPGQTAPAAPVSLATTWNTYKGVYVFVGEVVSSTTDFLSNLQAFLGSPAYAQIRFLWISNPNDRYSTWSTQQISVPTDNGSLAKPATVQFRSYSVAMNKGVSLSVGGAGGTIKISDPVGTLIQFNTNSGAHSYSLAQSQVKVRFNNNLEGCVQLGLSLNTTAGNPNFDTLDVGCRYFANDPKHLQGYVESFYFPIFDNNQSGTVRLSGYLDPLDLLNISRSYFTFDGNATLNSFFRTDLGHPVTLTPQTGAKLVMSVKPVSKYVSNHDPAYLTIDGPFIMDVPESTTNSNNLLCGLSGTETIDFTKPHGTYAGDMLCFQHGYPAYSPAFPIVAGVDENNSVSGEVIPLLDNATNSHITTAYTSLAKSTGYQHHNHYFAQSIDSSLFAPHENGIPDDGFLEVFPTFASVLNDSGNQYFPMVPFAGVPEVTSAESPINNIDQFEFQIIDPIRKNIVSPPPTSSVHPPIGGNETLTVTPQGVQVTVLGDDTAQVWEKIMLATTGSDTEKIELDFVSPQVKNAFQSNQQFTVVSKPGALGELSDEVENPTQGVPVFYNSTKIEDWPFEVNVGANAYSDFSNVVLFKFCDGSIIDWAKKTQSWSNTDFFIGDSNQVNLQSLWLQNYCAQIVKQVEEEHNTAFQNVYNIINAPDWNGMLVLKADIGLNDFPEDLKGLLGGIDTNMLNAHHFGIEINQINLDTNGNIDTRTQSSMFGLIDYIDSGYINSTEPAPDPTGDYDYRILTLQVLFQNSAITSFKSKMQLAINSLFDDKVTSTTDADGELKSYNTLLLDGSYENHDGQKSYLFNEKGDTFFNLSNRILDSVEVTKVQFKTVSETDGWVNTRFSIWGNLHFGIVNDIDLFSFDKLNYSNLGIDMSFEDGNGLNRVFKFDPTHLSFDYANSLARDTSMARHFPLTINGLVRGADLLIDGSSKTVKSPKDLGYLPVANKDIDEGSTTLSQNWYGISFNLNLGTLGALASKVNLVASIMVTWSPVTVSTQQGTSYAAGIYIKLPGTGGNASMFSLQGILKLTIDKIELFYHSDTNNGTEYVLKFTDIALKFLLFKFPSKGHTGMYLFGDPNKLNEFADEDATSSMGWYAAYQVDNS